MEHLKTCVGIGEVEIETAATKHPMVLLINSNVDYHVRLKSISLHCHTNVLVLWGHFVVYMYVTSMVIVLAWHPFLISVASRYTS